MVFGSFLQSLTEVLQEKLFSIAGTPINTATIILFVLIIVGTLIVSKLLTRSLVHYFRRSGVSDEGTIAVTSRLVHFIVTIAFPGLDLHLDPPVVDSMQAFSASKKGPA